MLTCNQPSSTTLCYTIPTQQIALHHQKTTHHITTHQITKQCRLRHNPRPYKATPSVGELLQHEMSQTTLLSTVPDKQEWLGPAAIQMTYAAEHAKTWGEMGAPLLSCVVLVEGQYDAKAVARAVVPMVYDNDDLFTYKNHHPACPLVVLFDPDAAGNEARHFISDVVRHVAHAFVPLWECRSKSRSWGHPVGNPGVGHATAFTISRVLSTALAKPWADIVPGAPRDGTVLMKQRMCDTRTMEQLGLVNVWNERNANKKAMVDNNRELVCAALGLGSCTAAELEFCLNRYGFTVQELLAVVHKTEMIMEKPFAYWKHLRACDVSDNTDGNGQQGTVQVAAAQVPATPNDTNETATVAVARKAKK